MDAVETKKMDKYLIKIFPDTEMPLNPRVDYDNLCVMACFHSRSCLGDQARKNFKWPNTREGMAEFEEWFEEHKEELAWLPLNLYEHTSQTISTSSSYPYNDPWDSTNVGVIYVEKAKILKEFGFKEWDDEAIKKANDVMQGEVKCYDYYLRGDVYGYQIINTETGEELDACWGFLGDREHCMKDAESIVEHYLEKDAEWEENAEESTVYLRVKVVVKHSPEVDPEDVINECDYDFTSNTDNAKIIDTEIQEQTTND